jgi:hypothetical protein
VTMRRVETLERLCVMQPLPPWGFGLDEPSLSFCGGEAGLMLMLMRVSRSGRWDCKTKISNMNHFRRWSVGAGGGPASGAEAANGPVWNLIFRKGTRDTFGGCNGEERPYRCRTCGQPGTITPRCARR